MSENKLKSLENLDQFLNIITPYIFPLNVNLVDKINRFKKFRNNEYIFLFDYVSYCDFHNVVYCIITNNSRIIIIKLSSTTNSEIIYEDYDYILLQSSKTELINLSKKMNHSGNLDKQLFDLLKHRSPISGDRLY